VDAPVRRAEGPLEPSDLTGLGVGLPSLGRASKGLQEALIAAFPEDSPPTPSCPRYIRRMPDECIIEDLDGSGELNLHLEEKAGVDSGAKGKAFEAWMLKAFDLLGMQYRKNAEAGPLWDLSPVGPGWSRLVRNQRVNLKVSRTKWAFSDRQLVDMLPWATGSMGPEHDLIAAAEQVRDYLNARGLDNVVWLRPKDQGTEDALLKAVRSKDVAALDTLMRGPNFRSTTFKGYTVRVTRHRKDPTRIGSVALQIGGRVAVRSELPRNWGSATGAHRVGFRREGNAGGTPHALREAEARVSTRMMVEQVMSGVSPSTVLQEEAEDAWAPDEPDSRDIAYDFEAWDR
jgi:hypothetical protein